MLTEIIIFLLGVVVCYLLFSEIIKKQYDLKLRQWLFENEKHIRTDAIEKSRAVLGGKFSEQIAPYLPDFKYNPLDARFIGAPIDFIIFDGLSEGDLRKIVFLEVKSGNSKLSFREDEIMKKIKKGKVKWELYRVPLNITKRRD
ncbi:MAG: Holliday junction resolvase [Candidatus Nanohalarchaeota archaeon]|nr:MAG: Holliday junction resolvase [Candidatus Nanohaloarchaeota archaeon]